MNKRIDFYKWINKKIQSQIEYNKSGYQLILYDFYTDYFDIKNKKIRIGIEHITNDKLNLLYEKIKLIMDNNYFDLIDMRMSLRTIDDTDKLISLLKFIKKITNKESCIIGFVNFIDPIVGFLNDNDVIDKKDEEWTIHSEDDKYIAHISDDNQNIQYLYSIAKFKKIINDNDLKIVCSYYLQNYIEKFKTHIDCDFYGEYFIIMDHK